MRNVTGAVAQGKDFFNRINEMAIFWRDRETDNLLLLAPRRVGKTSLMRKMASDAGDHGFYPVFVDVSDCSDLNIACRAAEGVTRMVLSHGLSSAISEPEARGEKLRYLLDILHNDGYLVEENRRWRFRSPLLREYWLRRVAPPEELHD